MQVLGHSLGLYSASVETPNTILKEDFSPVTFSCVFFTCDFHLPTLSSINMELDRTNQLGTAQQQSSPN